MKTRLQLYDALTKVIGYHFQKIALLDEALTHSSTIYGGDPSTTDNERLEFLGDSVLQLVLSDYLYQNFPNATEGNLTMMRAALVNRKKLAQIARDIDLGKFLILGPTEDTPEGRDKTSILGNALESIIGAIYLDGGYAVSSQIILKLFSSELPQVMREGQHDNPKGLLQEKIQSLKGETPSYEIIEESGQAHCKSFTAVVLWNGTEKGRGTGNSKKSAEIAAASDALDKLSRQADAST